MKNTMKALTVGLTLALATAPLYVSALDEMSVTVRIEGVSENLYYDTLSVPCDMDGLTVQDVLTYIDERNESLTITGADTGYISEVNGDKAGKFGGWDGWLYAVNGVVPSVSISDYVLSENDSIVLYYGDPYGVGMQYPSVDVSKLTNGILTFTSEDTVYDENYNASVVVNPVTDMTVEWFYTPKNSEEILSVTYITDKNGQIEIDKDYLTVGEHTIRVEKYNENGLPLVLRLPQDYVVTVSEVKEESIEESSQPESIVEESSQSESTVEESQQTVESSYTETNEPHTGDNTMKLLLSMGVVSVLALTTYLIMGKKKYEK